MYYFVNDHLGTPQKIVDSSAQVVWAAAYLPFGKAQVKPAVIENNLRFPGQYYDAESGLHYNWNRYYDPDTGRYLTTDPIGLAGGINLYSYALNNPVRWIDPFGLYEMCHRDLLLPIPYARHCYVKYRDGTTSSYDPKGVGSDPDPSQKGTICTKPQNPKKDKCIKNAMKKCLGPNYDFTAFNCCHCVEQAMKECGVSIPANEWPNSPINPGPQPGEPGYSQLPIYNDTLGNN